MRDKKRRLETYSFYDRTGIAMHLGSMAEKGWMIEELSNLGWVYRRITPQKLTFSVSYCPKSSDFDPASAREDNALYDFCEHTGWRLATSSAQMQIFYAPKDTLTEGNHAPVETDPFLEVDTIHRSAKRGFLPSYFILLAIALLNTGIYINELVKDSSVRFFHDTGLFSGICWIILIFLCITELYGYFSWHRKAKEAAARGEFLNTHTMHRVHSAALTVVLITVLCWFLCGLFSGSPLRKLTIIAGILYMAAILCVLFFIRFIKSVLKRKNVSAGINRAVTVLLCFFLTFIITRTLVYGILYAVTQ